MYVKCREERVKADDSSVSPSSEQMRYWRGKGRGRGRHMITSEETCLG